MSDLGSLGKTELFNITQEETTFLVAKEEKDPKLLCGHNSWKYACWYANVAGLRKYPLNSIPEHNYRQATGKASNYIYRERRRADIIESLKQNAPEIAAKTENVKSILLYLNSRILESKLEPESIPKATLAIRCAEMLLKYHKATGDMNLLEKLQFVIDIPRKK